MKKYQVCNRCVMDNSSDKTISFDKEGICNYCTDAITRKSTVYFPDSRGAIKLEALLHKIKNEGKGKEFDCIMGISGGLDSSYLLYMGYKWGLRILAVHIDDGFDTEISKENIRKLVDATGVNFKILQPNALQFNDLTKAYIRSGVPNLAVPQDNLIFAYMYQYARRYKIRHFLSGGNFSLESILQRDNTYRAFDVTNIRTIHRIYGEKSIDKLNLLSDYRRFFDQKVLRIETHRPLDYIDYKRDQALLELNQFCGFEYYGSKHLENKLTKFVQLFWFFNKFGVDKRRSHLSSLIITEQITRDEALKVLAEPMYDKDDMNKEIDEILETLDMTRNEFDQIMKNPPKQHEEYKTDWFYPIFKRLF